MATQEPKMTASRCTTEAETGVHTFEIIGYSFKRGVGIGNFFQSDTFTIGGHDWAIRFYPDGISHGTRNFVSISLDLMTSDTEVRARYNLLLVNPLTGEAQSIMCQKRHATVFLPENFFVARVNMLESRGYLWNDRVTIQCHLTVIMDSYLSNIKGPLEIQVPPSDLPDHFGRLLLEEEEGADVIFSVGGETFAAHKLVLATRSPVFKAQLSYGQVEAKAHRVAIEDMQPLVFKALLNFIYTDELPNFVDELEAKDHSEIIKHLLVAADMYAIDRLKLLCASILARLLCAETVATTLALADQHNCESLKDVCIEFMTSSDEMDAVVETQGYANLKRTCPSVLVEVLEKTSRFRKA